MRKKREELWRIWIGGSGEFHSLDDENRILDLRLTSKRGN